jgi:hypothetical protein
VICLDTSLCSRYIYSMHFDPTVAPKRKRGYKNLSESIDYISRFNPVDAYLHELKVYLSPSVNYRLRLEELFGSGMM